MTAGSDDRVAAAVGLVSVMIQGREAPDAERALLVDAGVGMLSDLLGEGAADAVMTLAGLAARIVDVARARGLVDDTGLWPAVAQQARTSDT